MWWPAALVAVAIVGIGCSPSYFVLLFQSVVLVGSNLGFVDTDRSSWGVGDNLSEADVDCLVEIVVGIVAGFDAWNLRFPLGWSWIDFGFSSLDFVLLVAVVVLGTNHLSCVFLGMSSLVVPDSSGSLVCFSSSIPVGLS